MNTSFLKGASGKLDSAPRPPGQRGSRGSLSTGPEPDHNRDDGAAQPTELPTGSGSGSGSDPVSEVRGRVSASRFKPVKGRGSGKNQFLPPPANPDNDLLFSGFLMPLVEGFRMSRHPSRCYYELVSPSI